MTRYSETEVRQVADEIRAIDGEVAERLDVLASALRPGGNIAAWSSVDVLRAIDPEGTANAVREHVLATKKYSGIELLRNVLALVPVVLTWFGLWYASIGYSYAIAADPELIEQPFLLLWQEGFRGHVPFPYSLGNIFTFSHVAITDALVLLAVVGLTFRSHKQHHEAQAAADTRAEAIRRKLQQIGWYASLVVGQHTSETSIANQFRDAAQGMLDELRAERERIAQIADERDRSATSLQTTAKDLKRAGSDFLKATSEIKAMHELLTNVASTLDKRVMGLETIGQSLRGVVEGTSQQLHVLTDVHRDSADHFRDGARMLVEVGERAAQEVGKVAQYTAILKAEISDLREQLTNERKAYEVTAQRTEQAAAALTQVVADGAQIAPALQSLYTEVKKTPAEFTKAFRNQQAAADTLTAAAQELVVAVQSSDTQLKALAAQVDGAYKSQQGTANSIRSSAQELALAAQANDGRLQHVSTMLERLMTTVESMSKASTQLEKHLSVAVSGLPSSAHFADALDSHQRSLVVALRDLHKETMDFHKDSLSALRMQGSSELPRVSSVVLPVTPQGELQFPSDSLFEVHGDGVDVNGSSLPTNGNGHAPVTQHLAKGEPDA